MFDICHRSINANEIIPIVSKQSPLNRWTIWKRFDLLLPMVLCQFDKEQSLVILPIVMSDLRMNQDQSIMIDESSSLVRKEVEYLNAMVLFRNFELVRSMLPWMMFQSILFNWLAYSIMNDWHRSFNISTYRIGKWMNSPISCRMDSMGNYNTKGEYYLRYCPFEFTWRVEEIFFAHCSSVDWALLLWHRYVL